jgi:hypothetical protein
MSKNFKQAEFGPPPKIEKVAETVEFSKKLIIALKQANRFLHQLHQHYWELPISRRRTLIKQYNPLAKEYNWCRQQLKAHRDGLPATRISVLESKLTDIAAKSQSLVDFYQT